MKLFKSKKITVWGILGAITLATITYIEKNGFPFDVYTTQNHQIEVNTVEIGFSPRGESLNLVLNTINSAETEILVAAYSFTSKPVSEALLKAFKRGVKVYVLADEKSNSRKYTATRFLKNQNTPVCLTDEFAIMHNKFIIVDDKITQTGSFNYSSAAVKSNAENVIVINNKDVAKTYKQEFLNLTKNCQY